MPELPEVETTRRGIAPYLRRTPRCGCRHPATEFAMADSCHCPQKIAWANHRARRSSREISPRAHAGRNGDHASGHVRIVARIECRCADRSARSFRLAHGFRENSPLHRSAAVRQSAVASAGRDASRCWRTWVPNLSATNSTAIIFGGNRAADPPSVKIFLMDQNIVVGVGNIYASEALFAAGIHPRRAAGSVSRARYARLADEMKRILSYAIKRGGTTLRDFINPDGAPGYFEQELFVYGRGGEPCKVCGTPIRVITQGQRSTFFCPRCQR